MDMIKISVIIPVYNTSPFLRDCLDSVLNQTYANFEVICVNDGSTDDSLSVLNYYSENHKNLIIIDQLNNGVSAARNNGLKRATGDYITFVDSDDYIDRNYLSNLVDELNGTQYDLICSGLRDFDSTGIIKTIRLDSAIFCLTNHVNIIKFLETPLNTSPVAKLYRRDIIQKFNIRFKLGLSLGEDRDFNLRFFSKCKEIRTCSFINYFYRKDVKESLTHQFHKEVLTNDYESIKLKKQVLVEKDSYNEESQKYISELILQLLFDNLISISQCQKKNLLFDEFKSVINNIGADWNELRKYSKGTKFGWLTKYLFLNKRFKTLLTIIGIKNKFYNV